MSQDSERPYIESGRRASLKKRPVESSAAEAEPDQ
jgi:hypothetical protein